MLTRQVYICEFCGRQSFAKEEILRCEAQHLGLTAGEMQEWKGLKDQVLLLKRMSRTNQDAKVSLHWMTANLYAFEAKHGLAAQ